MDLISAKIDTFYGSAGQNTALTYRKEMFNYRIPFDTVAPLIKKTGIPENDSS